MNQNLTLSERELTPILGIRNVKTIYNAFKHDIMFTFYDNLEGHSEKAWNLCWNEILGIFTTFYSWIPSDMQNIDNIPFSFNRDTVKAISKLGISDHGNDFSEGVTLSNNVLYVSDDKTFSVQDKSIDLKYLNLSGESVSYLFDTTQLNNITQESGFVGFLYLDNRLPDNKSDYKITYDLLRDNQGNYKKFEIVTVEEAKLQAPIRTLHSQDPIENVSITYLKLKDNNADFMMSELYYRNKDGNKVEPKDEGYSVNLPIFKNKAGKRITLSKELQKNPDKVVIYLNIRANVAVKTDSALEYVDSGSFESSVALTTHHNLSLLSTDFWKHG